MNKQNNDGRTMNLADSVYTVSVNINEKLKVHAVKL